MKLLFEGGKRNPFALPPGARWTTVVGKVGKENHAMTRTPVALLAAILLACGDPPPKTP